MDTAAVRDPEIEEVGDCIVEKDLETVKEAEAHLERVAKEV